MATTLPRERARIGARTLRRDTWWVEPLVTLLVLAGFVVYGTWVAFSGRNYWADPYLSPFYSPCLAASCVTEGPHPVGSWWGLSPALLILPFPLAFRLTCYYYRKAYYRAFWWSPPACAVPDARRRYTGETRFPLILQNVHRYFFYLALPFPVILTWDALQAFRFPDGFGVGLGTLVLLVNVALLWLYTLSCHSCRHLCGGHVDVLSRAPRRAWLWRRVTALNARHALFAWVSLFSVALADLYVRLVASGTITDPRLF
ncbi:MAG TPA: hypothetical protein VKG45_02700 [Actinomycetes bacterium]|nr:hypothetical protein [Actinomycetes bacterium]